MKKIELKTIERKAKKIFKSVGLSVGSHTWYFTVLFFVTIFVVAIWIWWNCLESPSPSSDIVLRVEQGKENYTEMKSRTEDVITTLQESRNRFENPPSFKSQRELFWEIDSQNPTGPIDDGIFDDGGDVDSETEATSPMDDVNKTEVDSGVDSEAESAIPDVVDEENKEVPVQ